MRTKVPFIIFLMMLIGSFSMSVVAWAAQYDIREKTPQIQQALSGRQARYGELQQLKSQGMIGENNQGFVQAMGNGPGVGEIVNAENRDRQVIYQAIVVQNQFGSGGYPQVTMVFAEVQRDKTAPGDPIQLPSGEWVKK